MPLHGDQRPVGQDEFRVRAKFLDEAENIIPASAIQSRRMVAQFVEDLVHFKRRQNGFDQDGGANRSARNAEFILSKTEHVVPQPRLQMTFHLREVEIRTSALAQQGLGIVKKEQAKIKQRGRDRLAIDQKVLFVQVPASRPHEQRCQIGTQLILLSLRTYVPDLSTN